MKIKFKKSYRLGISAAILAGFIQTLMQLPVYLIFRDEILKLFESGNLAGYIGPATSFFMFLLSYLGWYIFFGIVFIALINILPSSSIAIKAFVLNSIILIVFIPFYFLYSIAGLNLSAAYIIIDAILNFTLLPFVYILSYLLIAKKLPDVTKINRFMFVILVGFILFILMANTGILIARDMHNFDLKFKVDEAKLENDIFTLVNQKRLEFGNKPLVNDGRIYKIAKSYSEELAATGSFSHIDQSNSGIADRLKKENLFFPIAGENLYLIAKNSDNLAGSVVEGWMESPGHRSLLVDKDKFFTHASLGVKCDSTECYVVLDMTSFERTGEFKLDTEYYYYLSLNDPGYNLGDTYPLLVTVNANNPVDLYLFNSADDMQLFIDREGYRSVYSKMQTTSLSIKSEAKKNSFLLISNKNEAASKVQYRLIYN